MCFSPTQKTFISFLFSKTTHARAQNQTRDIARCTNYVCVYVCVRACVVRARLCEETARVVSFKNQTQVFRVTVREKRQKATKSDTHARGRTWEEEEERERKMSDDNAGTTPGDYEQKKNHHLQKKNEEEQTKEEEEEFILVDVPKLVRMLPGETLTFERLDTETPLLKTSTGETYEGYYERTVGEALIVELQQPALDANATSSAGRSGKKRVILNANGEEEEEEEDGGGGANVRAATETRLKFRKRL